MLCRIEIVGKMQFAFCLRKEGLRLCLYCETLQKDYNAEGKGCKCVLWT